LSQSLIQITARPSGAAQHGPTHVPHTRLAPPRGGAFLRRRLALTPRRAVLYGRGGERGRTSA
jgi:hypothetical protein